MLSPQHTELLCTVKEAARQLGVPTWKLRLAIKTGVIPHYTPFNSRIMVRLSEVNDAINATRRGGIE